MTDDADVNAAVQAIASVWGFHSGQICTAPTRVICHRSLYDQLVSTLEAVSGMLKVGDPLDDDTLVGPLISERQRDSVEAFIRGGVDAGATLVAGGERPDLPGYYVAPTLMADCTPDMHCVREEAFGPVVVVLPHDDDDEAVSIANDSDYGLSGGVWSSDNDRALAVAKRLRTGEVDMNGAFLNTDAPFGGYKKSGNGRELGRFGLEEFLEAKQINLPMG